MKPDILKETEIYRGRVFSVAVARIREGAAEYDRELVRHDGSAVIIPVFPDLSVAMVRQYRHAAGEHLLEIPAGTLEDGEDPETGARRELEEEIGVTAGRIEKLIEFYVSPGFLTELMHVFLATDLRASVQRLDADEMLDVERHPITAVYAMIRDGQIRDAKTVSGIILAGTRLGIRF